MTDPAASPNGSKPGHKLTRRQALGLGGVLAVGSPEHTLVTATLQSFLDSFVQENPDAKIDYIHGADVVAELGQQPGNAGFYLPALQKDDFFKTILSDGALPRKTFSMGEADEKRYYMECRKLL